MQVYGFPRKPSVPSLPSLPTLQPQSQGHWFGAWQAVGARSLFETPTVSEWSVDKSATENPAIGWEFEEPKNLTHVTISCDNKTQADTESLSYPLYCEYSFNNQSWNRLAKPAIMTSYFKNATETPVNNIRCYFWIPPNNVYAKYWRLAIPRDEFVSDYGDNTWHYSILSPGTVDKNVFLRAKLTTDYDPISDPWESYNEYMPWFNGSFFVHTGAPLVSLWILKIGTSAFSDGFRKFVLTNENLFFISQYLDYTSLYHQTIPYHTNNGFVVGVGEYDTGAWNANYSYLFSGNVFYSNYKAFGFYSNVEQGSETVHVKRITDSVPNSLGETPDVIMKYDSGQSWYITHPEYPDRSYLLNSNTGFHDPALVYSYGGRIYFPKTQSIRNETIVHFAKQSASFVCGKYTGTGVYGLEITGVGFMPSFVLIQKSDGMQSGTLVIDDIPVNTATGLTLTSRLAELINDGFKINNTDASMNTSSEEYLYWAWK